MELLSKVCKVIQFIPEKYELACFYSESQANRQAQVYHFPHPPYDVRLL